VYGEGVVRASSAEEAVDVALRLTGAAVDEKSQ
jgi:hypothetical protein